MITSVSVRAGSTGNVRNGEAFTHGDAPAGHCAMVYDGVLSVWPTNGTIVRVPAECELDVLTELLRAGYAVQLCWPCPDGRGPGDAGDAQGNAEGGGAK